jgi:hypothetical protein
MKHRCSRFTAVSLAAVGLLALAAALAPQGVLADADTLTVEVGPALAVTRVSPSVGDGAPVTGTLGGVAVGVRYGVTNHLELHATGSWYAAATFVNRPVTAAAPAGVFSGDLRSDLGRTGAGVGARYVLSGYVWRFPVGAEMGWLRTSHARRELVSSPGSSVTFAVDVASTTSNRFFVAPFAGVEWQAGDRISFSVIPRIELPLGSNSSAALVVPLVVGWTWYLP